MTLAFETPGPTERDWSDAISSIEEIIEDARNGRMFILVDHEDRENEGDLVIPAQMATPDAINFMATHGRGLICLALPGERRRRARPAADGARTTPRATRPPSPSRSRRARGSRPASRRTTARAPSPSPSTRAPRAAATSPRRATSSRCAPATAACWSAPATPRPRSTSPRLAGPQPLGRDLRDHERGRDHGPPARARRLRPAPRAEDRHDLAT